MTRTQKLLPIPASLPYQASKTVYSKMSIQAAFINMFVYSGAAYYFIYSYYRNKKKCDTITYPVIAGAAPKNFNRIKGYSYKTTSIVVNTISFILNRCFTDKEYIKLCLAGAIAPIYDDFFSNTAYTPLQLNKLTHCPSVITGDANELMYLQFYARLREEAGMTPTIKQSMERLLQAQLQSRKQNAHLDIKRIEQITFEKGGASLLLYASLVNDSLTKDQEDFFWNFGAFVQLIDDIFDVHEDLRDGVATLVTKQLHALEKVESRLKEIVDQNTERLKSYNPAKIRAAKIIQLYYLLSCPALSYIRFLKKAAKNGDLLDANNHLDKKYMWRGWKYRDLAFLVKYLAFAK